MIGAASCDFLDVVPDERPTEADIFADLSSAKGYLYSCYSYLPNPKAGASSLDLMTGDEVVTAFEHELFAKFCVGQFTASSPVISYWNTLFQGLRQCYILLNNIDGVPGMSATDKEDYKAQVHFLIAYYHFLQIRCYGSCILVKSLPDLGVTKEDYLGRSTLDECVEFVCSEFDKAAETLPPRRNLDPYDEGLATSVAAKALKAKCLLYAASPLFNGGGPDGGGIEGYLRGFKDKNGTQLMPTVYDPQKWTRAKEAIGQAITAAFEAGYQLSYSSIGNPHPLNLYDSRMRGVPMISREEMIWSDNRSDNVYGIAAKSLPHVLQSQAWNGVGPTLAMLKRFYTENGLPLEEDPKFHEEEDWWKMEPSDARYDPKRDSSRFSNELTMRFNTKREPRYYAWVAFHGGFFEVVSAPSNGGYASDSSYAKWGPGRLICNFVIGGNTSRHPAGGTYRTNNFSPSGFLNKKFVSPTSVVTADNVSLLEHPWPIIRLTDLYLMYAEACVETEDLATAREYLDAVRERAGVPKVEDAWKNAKNSDKPNTVAGLREIVRQERQIELYLENQNFWDMRRWLLAAEKFDATPQGMYVDGKRVSMDGTGDDVFNRVVPALGSGGQHNFTNPTHYFLPIPIEDVNRNPNVTQNPGY
jgi:hypothetical protein